MTKELNEKKIEELADALYEAFPKKWSAFLSEYDGEDWVNSLVDHTLDNPEYRGDHYPDPDEPYETVSIGFDKQKQEACLITDGCWSVITVFNFEGKLDKLREIEAKF